MDPAVGELDAKALKSVVSGNPMPSYDFPCGRALGDAE